MCDVDHTETIPKDQLTTLLNQIPTEFLHANPVVSGNHNVIHNSEALGSSTPTDTNSDSEDSRSDTADKVGVFVEGEDEAYEEVDNYTNHDIVEKAFNECDVRHEGRLDFEEFKMWVERTPQVIQYIEQNMIFAGVVKNPHGEKHLHKKETLPLMQRRMSLRRNQHSYDNIGGEADRERSGTSISGVHQGHSSTGGHSPAIVSTSTKIGSFVRQIGRKLSMSSSSAEVSRVSRGGDSVNSTPVSTPRGVDHKEHVHLHGRPHSSSSVTLQSNGGDHPDYEETRSRMNSNADDSSSVHGDPDDVVRGHLWKAHDACRAPGVKASILHLIESMEYINLTREDSNCPQEVAPLEGYLWKRGNTLHLWSKRYYVISGNCMYYYNSKEDVRVKGVVFLQGSNIQKIDAKEEKDLEIQGYFGFEISHMNLCTGEHHRHDKRVLYCRSESDRDDVS